MKHQKAAPTQQADPLLTNDEAAAVLNVAPATLEVWRSTRRKVIPYVKLGKAVRYRLSVLHAEIEKSTVHAEQRAA